MRNDEAVGILRDAKAYLDHAILGVDASDLKRAHHCMARVRECLTEVNIRLRETKTKKGRCR